MEKGEISNYSEGQSQIEMDKGVDIFQNHSHF